MNRILMPIVLLGIVVFLVVGGAVYQVDETEQVINAIADVGNPYNTWINVKCRVRNVRRFDKKHYRMGRLAEQIPTLDKRFIKLDTTRAGVLAPSVFAIGRDERSAQSAWTTC